MSVARVGRHLRLCVSDARGRAHDGSPALRQVRFLALLPTHEEEDEAGDESDTEDGSDYGTGDPSFRLGLA